MENIILVIILYFIASLVSDKANRNKRRKQRTLDNAKNGNSDFKVPPSGDNPFGFEISKLEGSLKKIFGSQSNDVYQEEEPKVDNKYDDYLKSGNKRSEVQTETSVSSLNHPDNKKESLILTKENVSTGIILSEILGKPKVYRRMRR